jgi:ADP-ribose pyrophosphatase YjhB (NUDIX family)
MSATLITYVLVRDLAAGRVLLVEYTADGTPNAKRAGLWLPAPELEHGEHPEDCAKRVLSSLGVNGADLSLAGVDSFVTKDWHVLFQYVADVAPGTHVAPDERYARAEWFSVSELPAGKAFAHGDWERKLVLQLNSMRHKSARDEAPVASKSL